MLEARNVTFSYGALQVLFDVSLVVHEGERVVLLGTNGAGKSTLVKVIAGLLSPTDGSVWLDGDDLTRVPADHRVRRGVTLIEGGQATFPSLTVRENLAMGAFTRLRDRDELERGLDEALELFPELRAHLDQQAGTLSGGEQQMMALGRAVVARPRVLIIDELSLGLAPVVMGRVVEAVEELVSRGKSMLLVEQSLNIALSLAERAYFMEKGAVQFSGPTRDLVGRGDLVRSVFFGDRAG